MKKLLGILVLGLMLASCSEYRDKKAVENCADQKFNDNMNLLRKIEDRYSSLKEKLKISFYERYFNQCEIEFKLYPHKFREKY